MPENTLDLGDLRYDPPPAIVTDDEPPDVPEPPESWDPGAHARAYADDPEVTITPDEEAN